MDAIRAKGIVDECRKIHGHTLHNCSANEAKGFLEAVEKFALVVEALKRFERKDRNSEVEKVLESYKRDVMGEK